MKTEREKRIRPQHNNVWSHRKNPEKTWKKMDMANKQWRSMDQLQQSNRKQNKGLQHIRKTLQENNGNPLGKITITPGTTRKSNNPQIKKLKSATKTAKKDFEEACKQKICIKEKLEQYYNAQRKLREALENHEREKIKKIAEISRKGGTNPRELWKIRKRIIKPPNQQ